MRALAALAVIAAGCAHPRAVAPNELVLRRVTYPDAGRATVGRPFHAAPAAQCEYGDGRPSQWATTGASVDGGTLPPGLTLEDGAVVGTPTTAGDWHFAVRFHGVACGGKPFPDAVVRVHLMVTAR